MPEMFFFDWIENVLYVINKICFSRSVSTKNDLVRDISLQLPYSSSSGMHYHLIIELFKIQPDTLVATVIINLFAFPIYFKTMREINKLW